MYSGLDLYYIRVLLIHALAPVPVVVFLPLFFLEVLSSFSGTFLGSITAGAAALILVFFLAAGSVPSAYSASPPGAAPTVAECRI